MQFSSIAANEEPTTAGISNFFLNKREFYSTSMLITDSLLRSDTSNRNIEPITTSFKIQKVIHLLTLKA